MPVYQARDFQYQQVNDHFRRQMVHLEKLMTVVCEFTNGPMKVPDPPHTHPHEQITYVAEGELLFFEGDKTYQLKKGDLFAVPGGVPHCIQTLSEFVKLIDTFTPLREEFLLKE